MVTSVPSSSSSWKEFIEPSDTTYVDISEAGIVFIVPPSLTMNPSPSTRVIDPPTEVSPSSRFSSSVVTEAPSNISNSASRIAALPIVKPPAVITPDAVRVETPVTAPPSILTVPSIRTAEPAAGSRLIAAPESNVKTPAESISTVPSAVI